ncbi:MAG TPA: cold shock domain-containing protein [Candidatus Baltobacteraceae bacterium]|nr:cold shock domain-containing protein [Candidatus Baltobacteraceae bacterium]
MTGSVKTMNEKGFGFITPDDGGKDLFFHQTGLVGVNFDELKPGDKVSFDTEESEKGPRATNVQRA